MAAMLCQACQGIFERSEWAGPGSMYQYPHSTYTKEITEGKQNGCQLCYMLCSHFDAVNAPADRLDLTYVIIESACMWRSLDFWYTNVRGTRGQTVRGDKHFVVLDEGDITSYLPDIDDTILPNTIDTRGQVLWWMKDCLENHRLCNQELPKLQWYPTRLLKIEYKNSLADLHVVITAESMPSGPYLTLSHRWGSGNFMKLTTENIDDLRAGLRMDDLPKTFRDAVTVAKWLDISYIWIDSLCIIQDSAEDWEEEAGRMSEVYQNAVCNIAATGAVESTGGLYFDRNPKLAQPCRVSPATMESPKLCILDKEFWENNIDQSPLIRRAWVVQERVLARRVIHFAKDQVFWECLEHSACETWPKGFMHELQSPYGSTFKQHLLDTRETSVSVAWQTVVSSYSGAQLTFSGDKEAALNGIITVFSERFKDFCVAGLWESQMASQLLWQSNGLAKHCTTYRAPSWSWLSIDGSVKARYYKLKARGPVKRPSSVEYASSENIEIIGIQVKRKGTKAFSPITSGSIKLRGRPRRANCHQKAEGTYDSQLGSKFEFKFDCLVIDDIHATLDNTSASFDDSTVWLLPFHQHRRAKISTSLDVFAEGLILQKVQRPKNEIETYERIGVFHGHGCAFQILLRREERSTPEVTGRLGGENTEYRKSFVLSHLNELAFDTTISLWEEVEERSILII